MVIQTNRYEQQNLSLLEEYFTEGCKNRQAQNLGIEVEHFIVRKDTKCAVTYAEPHGILYILEKLMDAFPDSKSDGREPLLGFSCRDFVITLEPAAQLEISITPQSDLAEIEAIYSYFHEKLMDVLAPLHYECATYGYQPASTAASLPLIPKKRYEYMDAYFSANGSGGMQMMRGTASTQISLDYFSEEDFCRRYQAAYLLMPVLKLLTDNTPVFEGRPNRMHLRRTEIWSRVDAVRTGIFSCVFDPNFGFDRYIAYLWNLPLIFLPQEGGADLQTKQAPARELFSDRLLSKHDILHILSMAFPDVRLKNYIEMRGADSLPLPLTLAYTALVKGLLYNPDVLDNCQDIIARFRVDAAAITGMERQIMESGWKSLLLGRPVVEIADELFSAAKKALPDQEQDYLLPLIRKMEEESGTA